MQAHHADGSRQPPGWLAFSVAHCGDLLPERDVACSARPHLEDRGHTSCDEIDGTVPAPVVQVCHEVHEGPRTVTWRQRPRDGGRHRAVVGREGHRPARYRGGARARRVGEWAARADADVREIATAESVGEGESDDKLELAPPTRIWNRPDRDGCGLACRGFGARELARAILGPDDAPEALGCRSFLSGVPSPPGNLSARSQSGDRERNGRDTTHARTVRPDGPQPRIAFRVQPRPLPDGRRSYDPARDEPNGLRWLWSRWAEVAHREGS